MGSEAVRSSGRIVRSVGAWTVAARTERRHPHDHLHGCQVQQCECEPMQRLYERQDDGDVVKAATLQRIIPATAARAIAPLGRAGEPIVVRSQEDQPLRQPGLGPYVPTSEAGAVAQCAIRSTLASGLLYGRMGGATCLVMAALRPLADT